MLHTEKIECYKLLMPEDPARTSSRIVSLSPFVSSVDSTTVYLQTTTKSLPKVVDGFAASKASTEQTVHVKMSGQAPGADTKFCAFEHS